MTFRVMAFAAFVLGLLVFTVYRANIKTVRPENTHEVAVTNRPQSEKVNTLEHSQVFSVGNYNKRAKEFTETELRDLTNRFIERFQPAIKAWIGAYEQRVPFEDAEITMGNFHSRLGTKLFTFVLGDTTLSIADTQDRGAYVFYLMTRSAAVKLNSLPGKGTIPDLTMPLTKAEIARMVKADTGIEYKLNDIRTRPTGAASSLMGGVYVEVGAEPGNGAAKRISPDNLSLVFGADGKLVNYQR